MFLWLETSHRSWDPLAVWALYHQLLAGIGLVEGRVGTTLSLHTLPWYCRVAVRWKEKNKEETR